ncbi:MAG TPA: hypothetical protein VKU44_00400 [Terriglobia bacterium]|nr:hypothetical protein [Terriglobia bacterium]
MKVVWTETAGHSSPHLLHRLLPTRIYSLSFHAATPCLNKRDFAPVARL